MRFLGVKSAGSTFDFKFNTQTSAGSAITLAGSPAISVYKANGTTESTSGITLTVDFDSRTGCHHVRIDTSADGTFYATGNDFQVVVTAGTVDGTSVVGTVLAHFTLGNIPANLKAIDEQLTSGNNATLNLKQLNIVNNAGSAIIANATSGNTTGVSIQGNGSGAGLRVEGGATGVGVMIVGGSTSGNACTMTTTSGNALSITSGSGNAVILTGADSGSGMRLVAGATGQGFTIIGGSTSGNGINITTTNGHGINLVGSGANDGFRIFGGATGHGIYISGGSTSGNAMNLIAGGTTGHALLMTSSGNSDAMNITGSGSGNGLKLTGGATGHGFSIVGGSTSGDGLNIITTDGHAIYCQASTDNNGIMILGGGSGGNGISVVSFSTGDGIDILTGGTGNAIELNTANGHGINIVSAGTGKVDINADINMNQIDGSALAATLLKYLTLAATPGAVVDDVGNTASTFKTNLSSTVDDYYGDGDGGNVLVFVDGTTNEGQARRITQYNGTTKFITVESPFEAEPSVDDLFIILGRIEV